MIRNADYQEAQKLLEELVRTVETEKIPLHECGGRILGADLTAGEDVPSFDRSPYDGYAVRAIDTQNASKEHPVTLEILEEVAAGDVPSGKVGPFTAVKILTGAPIPEGADAVVMYEKTEFTAETVTLKAPLSPGENIVRRGEDIAKGQLLASSGTLIDPGLAGSLAAQGIWFPEVFKRPVAGIISTGSELVDGPEEEAGNSKVPEGKIRNTNRYSFMAALKNDGLEPVYLGTCKDDAEEIADLIRKGSDLCDLIILTGGVSAGDYDLTPKAMEAAGCTILVQGVKIKPGMACCYGELHDLPVLGLSGNPSSSLINYYMVVRSAVRKMTGRKDYKPMELTVTLTEGFGKKSKNTRILKGKLVEENGSFGMALSGGQGNVVISSSIGCNVMAVVPEGSGPLSPGTKLKGFLL